MNSNHFLKCIRPGHSLAQLAVIPKKKASNRGISKFFNGEKKGKADRVVNANEPTKKGATRGDVERSRRRADRGRTPSSVVQRVCDQVF